MQRRELHQAIYSFFILIVLIITVSVTTYSRSSSQPRTEAQLERDSLPTLLLAQKTSTQNLDN